MAFDNQARLSSAVLAENGRQGMCCRRGGELRSLVVNGTCENTRDCSRQIFLEHDDPLLKGFTCDLTSATSLLRSRICSTTCYKEKGLSHGTYLTEVKRKTFALHI
jgi:hypothetical protein